MCRVTLLLSLNQSHLRANHYLAARRHKHVWQGNSPGVYAKGSLQLVGALGETCSVPVAVELLDAYYVCWNPTLFYVAQEETAENSGWWCGNASPPPRSRHHRPSSPQTGSSSHTTSGASHLARASDMPRRAAAGHSLSTPRDATCPKAPT